VSRRALLLYGSAIGLRGYGSARSNDLAIGYQESGHVTATTHRGRDHSHRVHGPSLGGSLADKARQSASPMRWSRERHWIVPAAGGPLSCLVSRHDGRDEPHLYGVIASDQYLQKLGVCGGGAIGVVVTTPLLFAILANRARPGGQGARRCLAAHRIARRQRCGLFLLGERWEQDRLRVAFHQRADTGD